MQNCLPEALELQTVFRTDRLTDQSKSGGREATDPTKTHDTDQLALAEKLLRIEEIHRAEMSSSERRGAIKRGARKGPSNHQPKLTRQEA